MSEYESEDTLRDAMLALVAEFGVESEFRGPARSIEYFQEAPADDPPSRVIQVADWRHFYVTSNVPCEGAEVPAVMAALEAWVLAEMRVTMLRARARSMGGLSKVLWRRLPRRVTVEKDFEQNCFVVRVGCRGTLLPKIEG